MRTCAQCHSTVSWSKDYCPLCSAPMAPEEQKTEQPEESPAPPSPWNAFVDSNQSDGQNKEPIQPTIPEGQTSASEFTVGSILSRTYTTLFRNPSVFLGIYLIPFIPNVISLYYLPTDFRSFELKSALAFGVSMLIASFLNILIQGALPYAVYQALRGNTATISKSFSYCIPKMGTLFLASSLVALGIGFGFLIFVIPGIILMTKWSVTQQACVVENLGARASMKRSAELTRDYRMKVFFLLLIMIVTNQIVQRLLTFIAQLIFPYKIISVILINLFLVIPLAFQSVMLAVIYYRLREIKEGPVVDHLANVFD